MERLMRKILLSGSFAVLFAAASYGQSAAVAPLPAHGALLDKYCAGCHNDKTKAAGFSLATVDLAKSGKHAERFEKVSLKLRSGMMPPVGMPRPDAAAVKAFVTDLEAGIDKAAAANPNPGRPILHRLNRSEYANSIRELLDLEIDPEGLLPADDMSQGYDNMSDVLTISPTLLDGYLRSASKISRLAIGDPEATPVVDTYVVPQAISQLKHMEGAPMGTRGGVVVRHNFPADGEYRFIMSFYYASIGGFFGDNKPAEGEQIEVSIDGERVAMLNVSRRIKTDEDLRTEPIKITAGPHVVAATFIQRSAGPVEDFVMPFERALADLSTGHITGLTGLPHLRNLGIAGPTKVTGISETASRRKILVCKPATAAEKDEIPCARKIVGTLARQAFRRPVTSDDFENLMYQYQTGRKGKNFEAGITQAVQAIVADPEFLFRFERTPATVAPGANYRISDLELASRLSFFLWSSPPDDQLITLASEGKLKNATVLEQQVKRMLADPRALSLSKNFASHWLRLQNLKDVHPDIYLYPDWDQNLNESMAKETQMFFDNIVRQDRSILELLTANYTFVDERLAGHYRIPNVTGNRFRRIELKDENRRGLLGQGSILTLTSLANRTSPVIRGAWILDVLMGTPPPNPPANVPPLMENEEGKKLMSARERLQSHRQSAACASCHNIMDPIGYSLENFDPVGAWRTKDSGFDIDPSGKLHDGTPVAGPKELNQFLIRNQDLVLRNFSQHLLMFAMGRVLQYYDMPAVRQIALEASRNENRFSAFVMGIVKSIPFQMKKAEPRDTTNAANAGGRQ